MAFSDSEKLKIAAEIDRIFEEVGNLEACKDITSDEVEKLSELTERAHYLTLCLGRNFNVDTMIRINDEALQALEEEKTQMGKRRNNLLYLKRVISSE